MDATTTLDQIPEKPTKAAAKGFDMEEVFQHPAFVPGFILLAGLIAGFWGLFSKLPNLWLSDEYYSHGMIVPFIIGYIIFKRWDLMKDIPVRPFLPAVIPVIGFLWLAKSASTTDIQQLLSFGLVATILSGIWFVAGGRWMGALFFPAVYTFFMLPIWTGAIDTYTNPLQLLSTDVAFKILEITGFKPWHESSTIIQLNNFTLDVGVPCSGFKLVLAVTAFTIFFVLIARLKFWGNLILVSMILPLCLGINGLRIAMIGMVGDTWGAEAGHTFHDWSGYITLIVCFLVLFKIARWLGWED